MAQITFYLDDTLADAVRRMSQAQNMSQSGWISQVVKQALANEWPADVVALAGSWDDMPLAETLRETLGEDVARESF